MFNLDGILSCYRTEVKNKTQKTNQQSNSLCRPQDQFYKKMEIQICE